MGKIFFVTHGGNSHEVDLVEGSSLMQIATESAVPGIDGDCGGTCACGTCHVILDSQGQQAAGPCSAEEEQMPSMSPERQPSSRLACQIKVTQQMAGMKVHLPEFQK